MIQSSGFMAIPIIVVLKSLYPWYPFIPQIVLEPGFYGDLVYKLKKIVSMADFSDQFKKVIMHHKGIGYYINVMRQSACLVINPITVDISRNSVLTSTPFSLYIAVALTQHTLVSVGQFLIC